MVEKRRGAGASSEGSYSYNPSTSLMSRQTAPSFCAMKTADRSEPPRPSREWQPSLSRPKNPGTTATGRRSSWRRNASVSRSTGSALSLAPSVFRPIADASSTAAGMPERSSSSPSNAAEYASPVATKAAVDHESALLEHDSARANSLSVAPANAETTATTQWPWRYQR